MNRVIQSMSHVISVLLHPIFVVVYGYIGLYVMNPYLFMSSNPRDTKLIFIYIIIITVLFPAIGIGMMRILGLVDSLDIPKAKQRIIPLVIISVFYCWLTVNMMHNQSVPRAFSTFTLGATISLFLGFFVTLFSKVSLHSIGVAGLTMGLIIMKMHFGYQIVELDIPFIGNYLINFNFILFLCVFLCGLTGTARLVLGAHTLQEVMSGFLIGCIGQIIALRFL